MNLKKTISDREMDNVPRPLPNSLPEHKEYRWLRLILDAASAIWAPIAGPRLTILIFHRVRPRRDSFYPGEPDRHQFADTMKIVASCFNCLPLDEALLRLGKKQALPRRAVAITFDDGYADNFTEALPILERYGLTATFFIASGFLDGGCLWNDEAEDAIRRFPGGTLDLRPLGLQIRSCRNDSERMGIIGDVNSLLKYRSITTRRELLDRLREITGAGPLPRLMMSSNQVRALHSLGMGIGGHTVNHPILACLSDRDAMREIGADRERLAGIIGKAPTLFAYPNGKPGRDYRQDHTVMVRAAGYRAAVTTVWGAASRGADLFQIPRFTPWDRQPLRFALRLAHNYTRTHYALA